MPYFMHNDVLVLGIVSSYLEIDVKIVIPEISGPDLVGAIIGNCININSAPVVI